MRAAVLAILLLTPSAARAVFVRSQMDVIDHEPLFDEEYFADLQSFSLPLEWEFLWQASTGAYRINAASLDCCDLLMEQDLKFRKEMAGGFSFAFRLAQQQDKDVEELHTWLEIEKKLGWGFAAAFYGEPAFRKQDSDAGFGLSWTRGPFALGVRRLFVDFPFNERGRGSESYRKPPRTDQAWLETRIGAHRLAASLELDHPLQREVPDEDRLFSYRRTMAGLSWRRDGRARWVANYLYQYQKKGDLLNPDPSGESLQSRRNAHRWRAALDFPLGERDLVELGQAFVLRAARADSPRFPERGVFYRRWEAQPYGRWRRRVSELMTTELSPFLAFGENRRRSSSGAQPSRMVGIVEAKLGAGLDFTFGGRGRLGIFSTFDLDALGSHLWDGGNIRALFFF